MKASDRVTKRVLATLFCLTALGIIAPTSGVMAQNPAPNVLHESQIIQPEGLEEGADFGFAIALGSEWLFVGEPGRFSDYGGVKNFRLTEGEWVANPWNFDPDDRNAFSLARYGQAIALAEQEDGAFFLTIGQARSFSALFGSSAARATSFFYDGTNWIWSPELPTATGPGSGQNAENFANSVAVSGSGQAPTVLAGAPLRPGTDFLTLNSDNNQEFDLGGGSSTRPLGLAIDGDRAAIGYGNMVIVLERADGATEFVETLTVEPPGGASRFGASVALKGNQLLVGAPDTDRGDTARAGQAFLFDLEEPEAPSVTLEMPDPISYERLGWSVAFGDGFVAASAPGGDGIFEVVKREGRIGSFDPETGDLVHELTAETTSEDDYFGYAIAARGEALLAGAPLRDERGAVFVFAVPAPEPGATAIGLVTLLVLGQLGRRSRSRAGPTESLPHGL